MPTDDLSQGIPNGLYYGYNVLIDGPYTKNEPFIFWQGVDERGWSYTQMLFRVKAGDIYFRSKELSTSYTAWKKLAFAE